VSEALSWTMVLSFAVAIAAISMLSVRIEQQTRAAFEAGLRNAMARLQERFHNRPQRTSERTAAGVSKRRSAGKRAGAPERRAFARRRLEDVFPSLKTKRSGI
jgi:hypothetical protein